MNISNNRKDSKDVKHLNRIMTAILLIILLSMLWISLSGKRMNLSPVSENLDWGAGWLMSDGTALSLPQVEHVDSLTIHKTLPEELTNRDYLVFSTDYLPMRVTVGGQKVDVVGTHDGKLVYSSAYSYVPLNAEMSGQEIEVTLLNLGNKFWMEIYSIKLGDFNAIRQEAFARDGLSLFSGALLMVASLVVFLIALALRRSEVMEVKDHTLLCMSGSALAWIFSVWTLADTESVALVFAGRPIYVFVTLFANMAIEGPWLMQVMLSTKWSPRPIRWLAASGLIEIGLISLMAVFGCFPFAACLSLSHVICTASIVMVVFMTAFHYRQRRDLTSLLLACSSGVLAILGSITLYDFYFGVSPYNIAFLRYGIFVYIIVMFLDLISTFRSVNQRYVDQIEAARQAAEEANRAKSEFLSSMSHDIRTPMNAIMGLSTIASAKIDNKEAVREALRKITLSSRHLLGLINDILDMSKIESGKISLATEELSLRELMENLVNIIQPQVKSRRQKFDIYIENISSEYVYCDSVRLNQVLLNLLSNAVKFTKEEGKIDVSVKQENSPKGEKWVRTIFRVTDNGIGMTPEFMEHIFDRFTRADNTHVHATEGSGLGMSITKHIVDMMEGTISVYSYPGQGSTFVVTLDLERMTQEEQNRILPPWNALVVDDDEPLCRSAATTLNDMGIHADWTLSGEEAVEMVDRKSHSLQPYHAVLLDWQMPGMNGIETARQIRKRVGKDVPILLITAYDWSEIEEEAREAGINGFLSKPLFESTLRSGLMHYVDGEVKAAEPEREEKISYAGRRLLIAEDDDINWEIDEEILTSQGFQVERAEDGIECLRMFEESALGYYDMILMDIRMPRMNGYQSAEAIRALSRPDAAVIPILAMTADAFSEDIQHCLEAGMNGHIAKPLDFKALLRLIKNYLKPKES